MIFLMMGLEKIYYKIQAPTFVDALSVTLPTRLILICLLKDVHKFRRYIRKFKPIKNHLV